MAQNFAISEDTFNTGGQMEASSLHQGSADELNVTFELPFCLKCTRDQKCYLDSFPLLPGGSSKSTLKLSLHSTEMKDFYIPYDSTSPNPVIDAENNNNVCIKPSIVTYRSLAEFQSLPEDLRVIPSSPSPNVFEKLPSNFNVPIQHPPIEGECSVLVLFLLGDRCFPFCMESSTPYPTLQISIDGKRYIFREILEFSEPQSLNEGLTVILFIRNEAHILSISEFNVQAHILSISGFNVQKEIELKMSSTIFRIILESYLRPSFNAANFPRDSYYFHCNTYNIRMKSNSFTDISVPENCDAPVFRKNFWSASDRVEFTTERLRDSSFTLGDKVGINIGSKGTLSLHHNGNRLHVGHRLFRMFIKENNDLISLQKIMKVSVKLSRH